MSNTAELPYTQNNQEAAKRVYSLYEGHLADYDTIHAYRAYSKTEVIDFLNSMEDWFDITEKNCPDKPCEEMLRVKHYTISEQLFLCSEGTSFGQMVLVSTDFKDGRSVPDNYTVNDYVNGGKFPKVASVWSRLTSEEYITQTVRPELVKKLQERQEQLNIDLAEYRKSSRGFRKSVGILLQTELDIVCRSISILSERATAHNTGNV